MPQRLIVTLLIAVLATSGCSAKWWTGKNDSRTEVTISPISKTVSFYNSKDTSIVIDKFNAKFGDSEVSFEKLDVKDSASSATLAEVEAIRAAGEAQKTQVAYLTAMVTGIAEDLRAFSEIWSLWPKIKAELKLDVNTHQPPAAMQPAASQPSDGPTGNSAIPQDLNDHQEADTPPAPAGGG